MKRLIISKLLLCCFITGCGGGILTEGMGSYDTLINEGWESYNIREYDDAQELFSNAKKLDDTKPEGYIGCGWALLRKQYPDSAVVEFRKSFDYSTSAMDSLDALCGLSGSHLARGADLSVIQLFKQHDVSYYEDIFPLKKHDFFLDAGDLEIVHALAFYRLGYYSSDESPDHDNAVNHLNQVLLTPYEYTDPESLMQKMTEYLELSGGNYTL